jgi:hypothetical protein
MNLFERLNRGRPQSTEKMVNQPRKDPTETLLEWLLKHWAKPTVTARDIYRSGPSPIRNDIKTILNLTQILAERGWLIQTPTWRHDKREWKITRGLPLSNK